MKSLNEEDPHMADAFGCPVHYATHVGEVEDAGGGNVRIFRCILRGNLLIPVYSLITPATCLMIDSNLAREKALALHRIAGMKLPYH